MRTCLFVSWTMSQRTSSDVGSGSACSQVSVRAAGRARSARMLLARAGQVGSKWTLPPPPSSCVHSPSERSVTRRLLSSTVLPANLARMFSNHPASLSAFLRASADVPS